jgi:UDP-glucose:(heptosyl)LPS alpha-1,3-glucosyltransferase
MRIAIATDNLSSSRGGAECYLLSLLRRLVADGHDVHVFYNRGAEQIDGGKYHLTRAAAYPRFLREWSFCRQADRLARSLSADAIFTVRPLASATHYRLSNGIHLRCFEAEREAFPIAWRRILYRTGLRLNPKQQLLMRAQRRLLTRADRPRLLTNSVLARRQLEEDYGIGATDVTVLHSGVDLELFQPQVDRGCVRAGDGPMPLLFVAHHFVLKGLHCLMATLASPLCRGMDLTLRVVGAGLIPQFKRLASRLGISSRVEFLGGVAHDRMPELYRSSAVLVHPTFYDPCSLATLEAMACGCPVITTRRNGVSELIESGKSGWIIDHPRDLESLARAIGEASRPGSSGETGREAALIAREKLDLNDHVRAVTKWLAG